MVDKAKPTTSGMASDSGRFECIPELHQARILENLTVFTGEPEYGNPCINKIICLDE
jgi:hypothetical protein